jgi:hypothetical protein
VIDIRSEVALPAQSRTAGRRVGSGHSRTRSRWIGPALFALCGAVLFFLFLAQASTIPATSESSGQALQAWDMLHGNLLLHGWSLSDVSFYTTELPEYMLVELVHGLNVETVHVAAALSYTLTLLLAALLAKGRTTGRVAAVRMLIAGGIMLAPSLGSATTFLLGNPDHMGTHVPLLIIYLVLDRAPRRRWVPVLVFALLTWAQIGDTLVVFEGALPLAIACGIRMYRRRGPIAGQWYDAALAGGALLSVVAAIGVLHVIADAGGFYVRTPVAEFANLSTLSARLSQQLPVLLNTFGADFSGRPVAAAFAPLVHLVGVTLVVVAVYIGIRRLWRDSDLIVQMLTLAFILVLAGYLLSTHNAANEIVGLLPIGAVLAGRVLGGRILRGGLVPVLAVTLACYAGIMVHNATQAPAANPSVTLARWLQAHHLDYGLAGFWGAGIDTVASGGHVELRPVRIWGGQLVSTDWESDTRWYDPRLHDAGFAVLGTTACGDRCRRDLTTEYGPPATTYQVQGHIIMVWHKNLLDHLPVLFWCSEGWPWGSENIPSTRPCS